MPVDVLILNTGVVDFRRVDFEFADELVGEERGLPQRAVLETQHL
jgi:hypothetical protein